jgi:hypothetical protein
MREGRLRPLADPRAIEVSKRSATWRPTRRDPALLASMITEAVA